MSTTYFRKSQIKLNAEKSVNKNGEFQISVYKSFQSRWKDTPDPVEEDVTYHFSKQDAVIAANSIALNLDYTAKVDKLTIAYGDLNAGIEFGESIELEDLAKISYVDIETVFEGDTNTGNSLNPDGVIVTYKHHRYMNYAYDITCVNYVNETDFKTEAELVNEQDSTTADYYAYYQDVAELEDAIYSGIHPFDKINSGKLIVNKFILNN